MTNPGCKSGPQGFHIYDTTQSGQPFVQCLECMEAKTEIEILGELIAHQPPHGSIVLVKGTSGTAWQRFYGTGSWKSVTGRSAVWTAVLESSRPGSRVWLVYVPPVR